MRRCDTCGRELEEGEPFAVCPQCLFGAALDAPERLESGAAPTEEAVAGLEVAPRLFARRDFFQKYEIIERVAQGGQGDIWKVWDSELRRCVAMKRLAPAWLASAPAVYRFLAEAQISSQLEHPGILPIFDVGLDPDRRPFYTTQLVEGATLTEVWRQVHQGPETGWTVNRALELLVRVCEVMAHAHSRGVIHRDLKPSNVLVGAFGEVRVIDWGSAHVLAAARKNFEEPFVPLNPPMVETEREVTISARPDSPLATHNSGQPITALFMPPEILRGQAEELGPTTDVYSVGVMLYELLAGRPPYARTDGTLPDPAELRELILRGPPAPVRSVQRGVSRDLAAVCQQAMAHAKSMRYQTMSALAEDLRAVQEVRPVQARRPGPVQRFQKWAQRNTVPVLLGGSALVILAAAFLLIRGVQAERDVARQLTALRSADLAARAGQWRAALRLWEEAEAAGFHDVIELGLHRAEAWTVLSSPRRSGAELDKLARRADLGGRRGVVLLRLGEHELFDQATSARGVEHVRQALGLGLAGAEEAFARGLLAETSPAALDQFRQALQFDPYHHGAHVQSMGLEFLLGRHAEFESHARVFKVLYPDDPSPGYLEATALAAHGRLTEARACLDRLRNAANSDLQSELLSRLQMLAKLSADFDVETLLTKPLEERARASQLPTDVMALPLAGPHLGSTGPVLGMRTPQLPCLQRHHEGVQALKLLVLPGFADPDPALRRIQSSWRSHHDALLPVLAATLLDSWRPSDQAMPLPLLHWQTELYQMGADSSSVIPTLARWSRYQAARTQFDLAHRGQTNSPAVRRGCLLNLLQTVKADDSSAAECRAGFDMAFALGDLDLARALLARSEQLQPLEATTHHRRIQLDIATGAFGGALDRLEILLRENPTDPWALQQRDIARRKLGELVKSTPSPVPTNQNP